MASQVNDKEPPSRVILRISIVQVILFWIVGIAITLLSVYVIQHQWHLFPQLWGKSIGYVALIFFGASSFVLPLLLFPQSTYLELNADGFNGRAAYRNYFQRWTDVSRFEVSKYCGRYTVLYNISEGKESPYAKMKVLLRFNRRRLCGFDLMIAPWAFGMKAEELASLLNLYRDWAIRQDSPGGE
jgi:hypothetical protein